MKVESQVKKLVSFAGEIIFIGLDVHLKSWTVTILTASSFHKKFNQEPDAKKLGNYLKRNFPDAEYRSAYESGFCGFSVHRSLEAEGIKNIVVHAADVPSSNKTKTQKTDGRDSISMAKSLRGGLLEGVYIQDEEESELRQMTRYSMKVSRELTRTKNRIKSMLRNYGLEISVKENWNKKHLKELGKLELGSIEGQFAYDGQLQHLAYWKKVKASCQSFLRKLSKHEKYAAIAALLMSIPGIGAVTAMIIISELLPITRWKRLDEMAAYVGLIPTQHSSGESERMGRLTNRGNKFLKEAIIESSWTLKSKDPAMTKYYDELVKRMNGNRAIIRVAKKLLSRIMFVIKNKVEYELGVVE